MTVTSVTACHYLLSEKGNWLPALPGPGSLQRSAHPVLAVTLGPSNKGLSGSILGSLPGQQSRKPLPTSTVPMLLATASAVKPAIWASHWGQPALMSSDSISVRSNITSAVLLGGGQSGSDGQASQALSQPQARLQAKDFICLAHACLTFWKNTMLGSAAQVRTWRLREVKKLTPGHTTRLHQGAWVASVPLWTYGVNWIFMRNKLSLCPPIPPPSPPRSVLPSTGCEVAHQLHGHRLPEDTESPSFRGSL